MRTTMRREVVEVLSRAGATAILVTHDQDEALSIADRVAVLQRGRIVQYDEPAVLYSRPVNGEVARFVGHGNMLLGRLENGVVRSVLGVISVELAGSPPERCAVGLLVRPEQIDLDDGERPSPGEQLPRGVVVSREFHGHDVLVGIRSTSRPGARPRASSRGASSSSHGFRARRRPSRGRGSRFGCGGPPRRGSRLRRADGLLAAARSGRRSRLSDGAGAARGRRAGRSKPRSRARRRARARAARVRGGRGVPSARRRARSARTFRARGARVGEDVDRHRPEPDDEARLVQQESRPAVRDCEQHDPRGEEDDRRAHEHRRDEEAHQRCGRAGADVLAASAVVANDAVTRARELERDGTEQQHPDEDVQREQPVDRGDRHALDREPDEQDEADERAQARVSERAAESARGAWRETAGTSGAAPALSADASLSGPLAAALDEMRM